MSIRFASFEAFKNFLADKETGKTSVGNIFICVFQHLQFLAIRLTELSIL